MSDAPVLVLQMQRMGDLIMTFPLLALLQYRYAGHPVWVMAEERFFTPLQRFSPSVVFFPPEAAPRMRDLTFASIVNVSHRADAAALCGSLRTEDRHGPYTRDGATYIQGYWALYRASLVHNNRYNRFHWSDLQMLDHVPTGFLPYHDTERSYNPASKTVCLVVGASEEEKRPSAEFWGKLARNLVDRGLRPFFVGGEDDKALGEAASRAAELPGSNMCGRFSLAELANVLCQSRLCITPDTGPMHLASWVGVPVINLSMGPVNPWETGPMQPQQIVVRPRCSCAGCWHCSQGSIACQRHFTPEAIAALAHACVTRPGHIRKWRFPGLQILTTGRDTRGRYTLTDTGETAPSTRDLLARFWQAWFTAGASGSYAETQTAMRTLADTCPKVQTHLQKAVLHLGHELSRHISGKSAAAAADDFWSAHPPLLRPLTGHLQLYLQNGEFRLQYWQDVLRNVEQLAALF